MFMNKCDAADDEMVELIHLYMNCVEDISMRDSGLVFRAPLQWDEEADLTDLDKFNELSQYKVALENLAKTLVMYFDNPQDSSREVQLINAGKKCLANSPTELRRFLVKEICFKHRADIIPMMKKEGMMEKKPLSQFRHLCLSLFSLSSLS